LANRPSCPPAVEESGAQSRKAVPHHLCAALTYAFLFLVVFASSEFLLSWGRMQRTAGFHRIPDASLIPRIPEFRQVSGTFEPSQTITDALTEQGLPIELTNQIVDSARPIYNLAKVKAGQPYWVRFASDGGVRDFRYPIDDERYLTVYRDVSLDRFVPVIKNFPFEIRVEPVSAVIEASLFASILSIGEMDQLALDLADIFGSDIDFYTDIQKGDSFRVLIEKKYLNGQFTKYGAILAAAFNTNQKLLSGYRFEDENGKPAYYAPDGRSLKRSFLKSPLKFARISSRFSRARMHPILKILRPHLGVDYAAQIGTPVQAVGAGIVIGAGLSGANGRMVRIRHAGGLETMYLHLSRIAVNSGAHVTQGQVVGYVGSSGLSTGPHLDFRILRHGKPMNPLKAIFPPGAPVQPSLFGSFAALRDKLNDELRMTNGAWKQTP
jgi:murein DD-endopeptidase MepM/ murein hydrolase activator NlpD